MTSNSELAVFAFLPGDTHAVPAGLLTLTEQENALTASSFVYGLKYIKRPKAFDIDPVGLAFHNRPDAIGAVLFPPAEMVLFGGIRDAAPDAWGRRVIEKKLKVPANSLPESIYLLEAGANRVGALDIRVDLSSPPSTGGAGDIKRLEYLLAAADAIEAGEPIPASLADIFDAGSSLGGMRPKAAVVDEQGKHWIAKFPSREDRGYSVPIVEVATLKLAKECHLQVPALQLLNIGRRPVMLIERFDRIGSGKLVTRRHFITALTMLGVHELRSPEMSYAAISEAQRKYGATGTVVDQQAELFGRMVFNMFVSNDDDHLRNHGFLWQDEGWVLSPLYDVVPRPSLATERFLHLGLGTAGRSATLTNAMSKHASFGLDKSKAEAIVERIWKVVREWRVYFEGWNVPGDDIEKAASAFRHIDDIR